MCKIEDRIKRFFPDYFSRFEIPEGAKEQEIKVYRACRTQLCDHGSFIPTFEIQNFIYLMDQLEDDPGVYSLSTFEMAKDIKRFATLDSDLHKPYKIAIGKTAPECGLSQRTRERKRKYKGSHVDWWLYMNAEPWKHFKIIDDFDTYFSSLNS